MRLPALAILLDRATLEAISGDRSHEQRGHGDGGDDDGEVTHGVFSFVLDCVVGEVNIPHRLFMQNLY
jgi:hypothetical protein